MTCTRCGSRSWERLPVSDVIGRDMRVCLTCGAIKERLSLLSRLANLFR